MFLSYLGKFDSYRLRNNANMEIGKGACGKITGTRPLRDPRECCAVKILNIANNPLGDILREVIAMHWYQNHPGVSQLLDVVECPEDGHCGIVMPFYEKKSYSRFCSLLDFPTRLLMVEKMLQDVLPALIALHASGLVHRDVKPDNIFVDAGNNCVLGDFGRCTYHEFVQASAIVTTALVESPQQMQGVAYGCKTDVWSLAITVLSVLYMWGYDFDSAKLKIDFPFFGFLADRPPMLDLTTAPVIYGESEMFDKREEYYDAYSVNPTRFLDDLRVAYKGEKPLEDAHLNLIERLKTILGGMMMVDETRRWTASHALRILTGRIETGEQFRKSVPDEIEKIKQRCIKKQIPYAEEIYESLTQEFDDPCVDKVEIVKTFVRHWDEILMD